MTKTASPTTVMVGERIKWTVTVTNNSTIAAADVNVVKVDERSFRTKVLSVKPSQGSCNLRSCSLGRLAPGGSATITIVTQATSPGVVINVVRVHAEEQESNYANNTASALARVTEAHVEGEHVAVLASCRTLVAAPTLLRAGSTSVVLATARDRAGRPIANVPVSTLGAGVDHRTKTNAQGVARLTLTPPRQGVILVSPSARVAAAAGARCTTRLAVLSAKATQVTG